MKKKKFTFVEMSIDGKSDIAHILEWDDLRQVYKELKRGETVILKKKEITKNE